MEELKNKKILLVDDEKDLLDMIRDILWSEGFFNVYTAENCKQALKIVEEQPIALCILDVNLPDGNGFSLYNDIRKLPLFFLRLGAKLTTNCRVWDWGLMTIS